MATFLIAGEDVHGVTRVMEVAPKCVQDETAIRREMMAGNMLMFDPNTDRVLAFTSVHDEKPYRIVADASLVASGWCV